MNDGKRPAKNRQAESTRKEKTRPAVKDSHVLQGERRGARSGSVKPMEPTVHTIHNDVRVHASRYFRN